MSNDASHHIQALKRSGKFVFVFTPTNEDRELSKSQLQAKIKVNFERTLSAYFKDVDIEPIANYNGQPERY